MRSTYLDAHLHTSSSSSLRVSSSSIHSIPRFSTLHTSTSSLMDPSLASPSPRVCSRLDAGVARPSPDVGFESAPSGLLCLSSSPPIIHPPPGYSSATTAAALARPTRLRSTPSAPPARGLSTTSNATVPPVDLRDCLPRRSIAPSPSRPGQRPPISSRLGILPHPEPAEGVRFSCQWARHLSLPGLARQRGPLRRTISAALRPSPVHYARRAATPAHASATRSSRRHGHL